MELIGIGSSEGCDIMTVDSERAQAEMLEEYKALRAEILMHIDRQSREYSILVPAIGVILTFAYTQNQPIFCFLGLFFTISSWWQHQAIFYEITKIGAYIEVFIEPETNGLRWESVSVRSEEMNHVRKSSSFDLNRLSSNIPTEHTIAFMSSFCLLVYLEWNNLRYPLIISLLVVILLGAFIRHMRNYGMRGLRANWLDIFREVKVESLKKK